MTLTISPADEACQAIVARINSGGEYSLSLDAHYSRTEIDLLEEIDRLRVDVVAVSETQPNDQLDANENSSHKIQVIIRSKTTSKDVQDLALIVRQVFLRLDNFSSSDRRVCVWECDVEEKENPVKSLLNDANLFVSIVNLRVEVVR
jgi:hypothetical protein